MICQRSGSISGKSVSKSIIALLCTGLALWPLSGSAQNANDPGGTLGIDCEVPRRSDNGKIILDWDGTGRIACEADRYTALHREGLLNLLQGHVAREIRKLEDGDNAEALASFMVKLKKARESDHEGGPVNPLANETGLDNLPGDLGDWKDHIGAAACGDWRKVHILVWLKLPRDRWSAAMAQRTINAWHARLDPRRAKYQTPWRLMDGKLHRVDGYPRNLEGCFETGNPPDWPDNWPEGETNAWLAAVTAVSWTSNLEKKFYPCDPGKFGRIEKTRRRVGGVYVYIDGEEKGQPIRKGDDTLATEDDEESWTTTREICWDADEGPGDVPDKQTVCTSQVTVPARASDKDDNPKCPVPSHLRKTCAERYPGYSLGEMVYRARTYSFPEDSKRDDVTGYHVENRCYGANLEERVQELQLPCPAGHVGHVKDRRTIRWWTFTYPPGSKAARRENLTFEQAIAALGTPPDRSDPPAFGTVSASPWKPHSSTCRRVPVPTPTTPSTSTERTCGNTCAERGGIERRNSGGEYCQSPKLPKCSRSGGNGNGGNGDSQTETTYDTDGDGYTDSYSPSSPDDRSATNTGGTGSQVGGEKGDGNDDGRNQ